MPKFEFVAKCALWTSLGSAVFAIVLFRFIAAVPLPGVLAALSLIPVGGVVIGGMLALCLANPDHDDGKE